MTQVAAYTTLWPTLITISGSSTRNVGVMALECIFHEAGHAMVRKVKTAIDEAAKSQRKKLKRDDYWHAAIFYTTACVLQRHLPGLVPYAVKYQLWQKGWPGALEVFEQDWKPYLNGKVDLKTAAGKLVRDLP